MGNNFKLLSIYIKNGYNTLKLNGVYVDRIINYGNLN